MGKNIFLKMNEHIDGGNGVPSGLKEQLNQFLRTVKNDRVNMSIMDLAVFNIKFDPFYRLLNELLVQWDPEAVHFATDNLETMVQWDPFVNLIVNETCWSP